MTPLLVPALLAGAAAAVLAAPRAARSLAEVGLPAEQVGAVGRAHLPVRWPAAGLAGAAGWVLGGPVLAGLGSVGALVVVGLRREAARRRVRGRERAGAVEALAVLAAELRSGRTPDAALAAAAGLAHGPLEQALLAASRAAPVGADPAVLLRAGASGSAVPEVLQGLATCWALCASTGASLTRAIEVLAASQRAGDEQRRAVEAELAGPRATAALLAVLPVAGLALAGALGADPLQVLLHTPLGAGCTAGAVLLDGLGLWWTHAIVAGARGGR